MRRRNEIVDWILYLVILAAILLVSKFAFELIAGSNMPDWLKWFLLK